MTGPFSSGEKRTVLVVEDEPLIAMSEASMLERDGFKVVKANSAREAIATVNENDIDLVLMDIDLGHGKMDGTEAARIILKDHGLPIVFCTGHTEKEFVDKVDKITGYGYIVKNSGEFVLVESINMAFKLFNAHQKQKEKEEQYELALYGGRLGTWDWNIRTDEVRFNKKWAEMKGYSLDEIKPHIDSWKDRVHPDDLPGVLDKLNAHLRGDTQNYEAEFRMHHKSGDWVWIVDRGKVIEWDKQGNPVRACGTHLDITEKKRTEDDLKRTADNLAKRVRELECLYDIGRLVSKPESNVKSILSGTVELICKYLDYPSDICCSIVLYGAEYRFPEDREEGATLLQQPIFVQDEEAGYLEIKARYEDRHEESERLQSFASDEKQLMEMITERLGRIIERITVHNRHQILLDSLHEAVIQADQNGIINFANPAAAQLCGYDAPEELVGRPMTDLYADPSQRKKYLGELKNRGVLNNLEFELKRKDGYAVPTLCNIRILSDENGKMTGTLGSIRDISQIKALIDKLRENKEFYETTLHSIGDGVIVTDRNGDITLLNPVAEALIGYSNNEADGIKLTDIFHIVNSVTNETVSNPIQKVLSSGEHIQLSNHTKLISKNGKEFQIADSASPIKTSNGTITGAVLVFRDETVKYEQERELRKREEQFRRLFENTVQGIVYHAPDGKVIKANKAAERILGLSYGELVGKTSMDPRWKAIHEDGRGYPGETHPAMISLKTGEKVERSIMGVFHPIKNEYVWISVSAFPEFMPGEPTPYRVFATFEDITESKKREIEQRKHGRFLQTVFDSIQESISLQDKSLNIVRTNHTVKQMFHKHLPLEGRKCYEVYRNMSAPCGSCPVLRVFESKKGENEIIDVSVNGTGKRSFELFAYPVFNDDNEVETVIEYARDITERKQMMENLQKALREKDFLMKELNHRVKNNLAMISSLINLKNSDLEDVVDISDLLHQIDTVRIVHDKLYQTENVTELDLNEYIQDILNAVLAFCRKPVELENNVGNIQINPRQAVPLGLIVNELATNAIKHGFVSDDINRFTVSMSEDKKNNCSILTVSNTGRRFPKNINLERPKTLGLQLVSALVEQLDGTVALQREPYPVFTIRFPMEKEAPLKEDRLH